MAGDYYGDEGSDEAGPSEAGEGMAGGDKSMGSDTGMDKDMGETTLIPRSLFGGHDPKPNEEYYFKVVATHGDEIEIAYSKGEEESEHKEGSEMAEGESEDTPDKAFNDRFAMMG